MVCKAENGDMNVVVMDSTARSDASSRPNRERYIYIFKDQHYRRIWEILQIQAIDPELSITPKEAQGIVDRVEQCVQKALPSLI